ncbi:RNA 2',3'-cyclic phosphodiesterase [Endozoicomonas euniceicola]|uniref:RNA 2',3'-cyclic phosphodiesterase n=1 Tax=Endozoicomonas euniceicola TaxID=1234143 RepID=A0ABY6GW83_9GAMM|nr:RNA 2',3'-cyclic phosphodiesterase [Endozoicomonas euniceicola]UYM17018.1 RNA 2',3'-cyclic phosphodiesterase [Endozoicomonas euniceicola]
MTREKQNSISSKKSSNKASSPKASSDKANPRGTASKATVRAFVAIKLPLELAAMLHKKARNRAGDALVHKMRWAAPQQQHITLRFLGECTHEQLKQYSAYLESAFSSEHAFSAMTGRYEVFPDTNRPRVLALSMHSGQQLNSLARICEEAAAFCGLRQELRNFRPHVTLARFKQHHHVSPRHFFHMPSFRMSICEVVLMQSETSSDGATYRTLQTFPLQSLVQSA